MLNFLSAAESGQIDIVKVLLEYEADVNAKESTTGATALIWGENYEALSLFYNLKYCI